MKPFSIYFPQFYPTPTNNDAWGEGFTDWALVANANLRDQWVRRAPRRGFYDGASSSVHLEQMEEMTNSGLGGAALYHYWFYSHQELDAFESTLIRERKEFPWFLIWATESWSKRWLGDSKILINLKNNPNSIEINKHCDHLVKCFSTPGYLFIDNKPLFVIYNLSHFDQPEKLLESYRLALEERGFDICIGHFLKNPFDAIYSHLVDVTYLFEPRLFFGFKRNARGGFSKNVFDLTKKIVGEKSISNIILLMDKMQQKGKVYRAADFLNYLKSQERDFFIENLRSDVQEVLSPGWNNIPRYQNRFTALQNIEADCFAKIITKAVNSCYKFPPLVNAWNEWSEGAAIEPCAYLGDYYLDAINKFSDK